MASSILPVPTDPTLLADIRQYGKFDATGCYQCGSCTLSCDLASNSVNFPRKSIRYALLGLRKPLVGGLEPWLCEDCGDCSIVCPRQADPRTSMVTLRRFLIAQYDWTGISHKLLGSRAWYLGSLISTAMFTALLILGYHLWYVGLPVSQLTTALGMEHMFPVMTYYTLVVILFPILLLASRVFRVWRLTMNGNRARVPLGPYVAQVWTYVYDTVTQAPMRKCPSERGRWLGHWLLATGTGIMLTVKVLGLRWFQTDNVYPLYNPQRWLGYVACAFILYGVVDVLKRRVRREREEYKETRVQDWGLPVLLLLTAITGISVHIFRYAGFALCAHFAYALHVIVATPMLVVEMAFGKWAHMIYRPLALYFQAVKHRAEQIPTQEGAGYAL